MVPCRQADNYNMHRHMIIVPFLNASLLGQMPGWIPTLNGQIWCRRKKQKARSRRAAYRRHHCMRSTPTQISGQGPQEAASLPCTFVSFSLAQPPCTPSLSNPRARRPLHSDSCDPNARRLPTLC
ncbi:hypothetical protein BKA56DRAFT_269947 [Ilyonectria sp. MPI-CAGE-AT-0026]|nr:hypothetical protein BKA56DRAFT_269947 [Ilyonectria sp. MPI-CAGE-AT-0026]